MPSIAKGLQFSGAGLVTILPFVFRARSRRAEFRGVKIRQKSQLPTL
jgi:hypothetical protein